MFRAATALKYVVKAGVKCNAFSASKVPVRFAGGSKITTWNKDWMPGPYPKTEEERIAAAQKYNLLPEDYEPYPEEEGFGDYPKFPPVHMEYLSDHEVYDFPVYKRNFGQPIHPDFDMCLEDKVNFQEKADPPMWKQYMYHFIAIVLWSSLILYEERNPINLCQAPKQYPHVGLTSYTFEPAE